MLRVLTTIMVPIGADKIKTNMEGISELVHLDAKEVLFQNFFFSNPSHLCHMAKMPPPPLNFV